MEDVKTLMRLIPLVVCITISVTGYSTPISLLRNNNLFYLVLNNGLELNWLPVLLLVPFYQFLLHPFLHKCRLSMLKYIGTGLFMQLLGYILLKTVLILAIESDGVIAQGYISCSTNVTSLAAVEDNIMWYWKVGLLILFGVGHTMAKILLIEFIIAQSPYRMKGLTIGIYILATSLNPKIFEAFDLHLTLCYDIIITLLLAVLFVVFLILSKWYTLRERNREINIQAIVEEHYERYMDQEEEYMRQCHQK